jgi:hypothetical protein
LGSQSSAFCLYPLSFIFTHCSSLFLLLSCASLTASAAAARSYNPADLNHAAHSLHVQIILCSMLRQMQIKGNVTNFFKYVLQVNLAEKKPEHFTSAVSLLPQQKLTLGSF